MTTMTLMTRTEVRDAVACPACEAPQGERCRRMRGGPRESNHAERVKEAEAQARADMAAEWVEPRDWNRGELGGSRDD